jgi:hypothetical protein
MFTLFICFRCHSLSLQFFAVLSAIKLRNTPKHTQDKAKINLQGSNKAKAVAKAKATRPGGTARNDSAVQQAEQKMQRDLDRDLAEGETAAAPEEKARVATALLKAVVRIFTLALDSSRPSLVIPALTGLARSVAALLFSPSSFIVLSSPIPFHPCSPPIYHSPLSLFSASPPC